MAAFFGAGFSESEEDPESEESFLAAFLAGAFLTGLSLSESEEDPEEEESFLAAFLAGAAFLPLTTSTDDSESLSEEESWTLDFLTGTAAFSEVFLDLFLEEEETLDSALGLLAMTLDGFFSELEEELEELLELDAFLLDFLSTVFLDLFLESSIDCFLDGASDEEAETFLV